MPEPDIKSASIWENGNVTCMARVLAEDDGDPVQQADLSTITCAVYDRTDQSSPTLSPTVTISSAVFDTLQTSDSRWSDAGGDSTGYNFLFVVPGSAFPNPSRSYQVEFLFTDTSANRWPVIYRFTTTGVISL